MLQSWDNNFNGLIVEENNMCIQLPNASAKPKDKNKKKHNQTKTAKAFCTWCFKGGRVANNHRMKDSEGRIICPDLRSKDCQYCHQLGHFMSHCPVRIQQEKVTKSPEVAPLETANTNQYSVAITYHESSLSRPLQQMKQPEFTNTMYNNQFQQEKLQELILQNQIQQEMIRQQIQLEQQLELQRAQSEQLTYNVFSSFQRNQQMGGTMNISSSQSLIQNHQPIQQRQFQQIPQLPNQQSSNKYFLCSRDSSFGSDDSFLTQASSISSVSTQNSYIPVPATPQQITNIKDMIDCLMIEEMKYFNNY